MKNMSDCIFCKIITRELPSHSVYEDDAVFAFLDIHPVNPGHTLIVPKRHSERIEDAPQEDVNNILATIKKIAPGILAAVRAKAFNIGVNNGAHAGQLIPHIHFHLMPRFPQDGLRLWSEQPMSQDELKSVADKIRSAL